MLKHTTVEHKQTILFKLTPKQKQEINEFIKVYELSNNLMELYEMAEISQGKTLKEKYINLLVIEKIAHDEIFKGG